MQQKHVLNEYRKVTVLFVNLTSIAEMVASPDDEDTHNQTAKSTKLLRVLHSAMRTMQGCLYDFEGSLRQFIMDDKGTTLIGVFGLYPMAHENDPLLAVRCAMAMHKRLLGMGKGRKEKRRRSLAELAEERHQKNANGDETPQRGSGRVTPTPVGAASQDVATPATETKAAGDTSPTSPKTKQNDRTEKEQDHELPVGGVTSCIGITTGMVYAGVVGNDKRCEYAVIGDVVNLSARLMVAATKKQVSFSSLQCNYFNLLLEIISIHL